MVSFELNVIGDNLDEVFKKIEDIKEKYKDAVIIVHMDCR